MTVIEFEGKTTEEAIEKACNQLHLPSDELKFEILSTGSSGIFGLGGKKASIRVNVEERIIPRPEEEPRSQAAAVRAVDRAERQERTDHPERSEQSERREPKPRFTREKSEPRPRRETPPPQSSPVMDDEDELVVKLGAGLPLPPTVAAPGEVPYEGPEDEAMTQGRQAVEAILSHMEIVATVNVGRIEDRIILTVEGDNSGLLIGKKGATLDALQFLVNKIVNRTRSQKFRVVVDTEDYRQRRHQALIDLAGRMAEKAKRTKRPVTISQLSAYDRRVVHLALQDRSGIKTRSRGDGPLKNVVIVPGGARGGGRRPGRGHQAEAQAVATNSQPEVLAQDYSENES
jgi:spoIIIJ-associated protein